MKLRLLLTLALLTWLRLNFGQKPDVPVFHSFDSRLMGVKQAGFQCWDQQGRMWAITDNGLLCYNGYHGKHIPATADSKGPLSTNLRTLWKISESEFWITYKDQNNITHFNPNNLSFNHLYVDTTSEHGLPDVALAKIIHLPDSNRYIASWGAGLLRLDMRTGVVIRYANSDDVIDAGDPPTNFVKDLIPYDEQKWLCGFFFESDFATPYFFYPATGKFEKLDLTEHLAKLDDRMQYLCKLGLGLVNFLYMDKRQNIWVGAYTGLFLIDQEKQEIRRISAEDNDLYRQNLENTRNYLLDKNGLLWIGTPNQGIMLVHPEHQTMRQLRYVINSTVSISDDRILTINEDPHGNIWIASTSGIFNIANPLTQKFDLHPWYKMGLDFTNRSFQQIPVNQVLVQPNGDILISSASGITNYNSKTGSYNLVYKPVSFNTVKGTSDQGISHFANRGDILFMNIQERSGPDAESYYSMHTKQTTKMSITVGMNSLLFRHGKENDPVVYFNPAKGGQGLQYNYATDKLDSIIISADSLSISEKFTLHLQDGSWMYPFAEKALGRFYPATGNLEVYHAKSEQFYFPDSIFNCAYDDEGPYVWFGTPNGVYRYHETEKTVDKFNQEIGLLESEPINSITKDKNGTFWLAGSRELLRWSPAEKDLFRFNEDHGLNVGNFLPAVAQTDSSGHIYIATYKGILKIDPTRLIPPDVRPVLYLEAAYLNDKPISSSVLFDNEHDYASNENYFMFEFYTNELFTLTPTHFFYKLTGRDSSWIDNGVNNRIRLDDVTHGNYTLEIKAVNSYNNESNILRIPIHIAKPFYLQSWFILLVIILLALLIFAYIKYREKALRKKSLQLEKTVRERTADVVREKQAADLQRLEAEHQKALVEEKQKEITDSINYAKRIQDAILPSEKYFREKLPESFILYLPKDVVAGDFYFMEEKDDKLIVAVADCTGHGVPGAMVSVVCHNALVRCVKEFGLTMPDQILNRTRELILETFEKSENQVNDGMDISLVTLDKKSQTLHFSGANNGLILLDDSGLIELKADKQPVGKFSQAKPFTLQSVSVSKRQKIYLYTDGYADQFGGDASKPGGKKFKMSRLKELIQKISAQKLVQHREALLSTHLDWRGEMEQVDDICIIGFTVD